MREGEGKKGKGRGVQVVCKPVVCHSKFQLNGDMVANAGQ